MSDSYFCQICKVCEHLSETGQHMVSLANIWPTFGKRFFFLKCKQRKLRREREATGISWDIAKFEELVGGNYHVSSNLCRKDCQQLRYIIFWNGAKLGNIRQSEVGENVGKTWKTWEKPG